jgi:hypothetical protein
MQFPTSIRTGGLSKRLTLAGSVVLLAVCSAASGAAQQNPYRKYTQEHFEQNMQTAGRNYAAVADLLAKGDYESAKAQLTRAREQLAITVTFWRDRKKDDAVAMLRAAVNRMDDLDAALSAEKVEASAVNDVSRQITAACEACHAVYRDQDPVTKAYRVKPGSVR